MRVLYRYASNHIPEDYLREIEAAGFDVSAVATLKDMRRLIEAVVFEPIILVLEKNRSEFQHILNFIKELNVARKGTKDYHQIAILVLSTVQDSEYVADAFESEDASYLVRRLPITVVDKLYEVRRLLRRVHIKARIRLVVTADGLRVWLAGKDRREHEFILSARLAELIFCLARKRYANVSIIAKYLQITHRSVKMYLKRLRDAFDKFNRQELHLGITGAKLIRTFHFADDDIYRLMASVVVNEKTALPRSTSG